MCSKLMRVFPAVLIIICVIRVECESTFDCYRDKCVRGLMYCVDDRQRCYRCADRIADCDSDRLPRDCDAFCVNQILENTVKSLNRTIDDLRVEKRELKDLNTSNDVVILSLKDEMNTTRRDAETLLSRLDSVLNRKQELALKLNLSEEENENLKDNVDSLKKAQNRTLKQSLGCSEKEISDLEGKLQLFKILLTVAAILLLAMAVWIASRCFNRIQPRRETTKRTECKPTPSEVEELMKHNKTQEIDATKEEKACIQPNIHVSVINEYKPESSKRGSRDSGVTESGSNSSINKDGQDKAGEGGSSRDLHIRDTSAKKPTGPETETGCECGHPNSSGVRPCKCKTQICPTDEKPDTHGDHLYN